MIATPQIHVTAEYCAESQNTEVCVATAFRRALHIHNNCRLTTLRCCYAILYAGSVRVLGRRQIEMYSKLIHTVDHVEGYLRPGFDALDAFLCHTWAVTVTGAPKTWAIQVL
jgi:chorismate binding enzyme